jgi:predicted nucleotide-binding protein (sugar kinase/HSP70/actin superfamily)
VPAKVSFEHSGILFIDSAGERMKPTDPRVKMLVPQMGTLTTEAFAAFVRGQGMRAEALPITDTETLHLGRAVTTGKECLPLILIIGGLAKYLKYRKKSEERDRIMVFIPKASGHCRLGQYHVYMNQYIRKSKLKNIALLDMGMEEQFAGFGATFNFNGWKAIVIADVMEDIKNALIVCAKDKNRAMKICNEQVQAIYNGLEHGAGRRLYSGLFEGDPFKSSISKSGKNCPYR